MEIKEYGITFIEMIKEIDNISSFLFEPAEKFQWKAGQHGVFINSRIEPVKEGQRVFTIASIPSEGRIRLTTKVPETPSLFKQALLKLKPGETLTLKAPMGNFTLEGITKNVVFIAGGVGITPFRSMLLDMAERKTGIPASAELFYLADNTYVYREEFEALAKANEFLQLNFLRDRNDLEAKIKTKVEGLKDNAVYFVSGPPPMVESYKNLITGLGIDPSNIKTDVFTGY